MSDCVNCKVICANCYYYMEGSKTCSAFYNVFDDCVTGQKQTTYDLCSSHNADGNCKQYSENKHKVIVQQLLNALSEYLNYRLDGYINSSDYLYDYASGLKSGLLGGSIAPICFYGKDSREACESFRLKQSRRKP